MNYILDTHVFLWSLFETKKLSKNTTNIILNIENNIFISVITFFEISLKYNLSKIKLKNIIPEDLPSIAKKTGFDILDLRPEVASSFYRLPKIKHKVRIPESFCHPFRNHSATYSGVKLPPVPVTSCHFN